jgi:hypothetical protein
MHAVAFAVRRSQQVVEIFLGYGEFGIQLFGVWCLVFGVFCFSDQQLFAPLFL